jgi:tRNA threonylcarbamoyladenosine biosynthesis protein TsaB
MPSLDHILAAHAPLLLLDAASARIQAGWLPADAPARWASSEDEAGVGVFRCVEALGADLDAAGAFVFCAGPGSILGIRTVAMALRAWNVARPRPAFAYRSLELVAQALGRPGVGVIADARRDLWHLAELGRDLRRVTAAELPEVLAMPDGFRHWSPLPAAHLTRAPYLVSDLFAQPAVRAADLLQPAAEPDAFIPEEPAYAAWVPKMHGR